MEKDKVISGMLCDELNRCQEMLDNLEESISEFPKGAISKLRGMRSLSDSNFIRFPVQSPALKR